MPQVEHDPEVVSFLENFHEKYPMYSKMTNYNILHKLAAKHPVYAPILDKWEKVDQAKYGGLWYGRDRTFWESIGDKRRGFMPGWAIKRKMFARAPREYIKGLVHNAIDSFAQGFTGIEHEGGPVGFVKDKAVHDVAYTSQVAGAAFKAAGIAIAFGGLRKVAGSALKRVGLQQLAERSLVGTIERGVQAAATFGSYRALGQTGEITLGDRKGYDPVEIAVASGIGFLLSMGGETGLKLARQHWIKNWKANWRAPVEGGRFQKWAATTKNRAILKAWMYESPDEMAESFAQMYKANNLGGTQKEWIAAILNGYESSGVDVSRAEAARFSRSFLERSLVKDIVRSPYQAGPVAIGVGAEVVAPPIVPRAAELIGAPRAAGAIATRALAGQGFVMGQEIPAGVLQPGFLTDPERGALVDATLRQLQTQDAVERTTREQLGAAYRKTRARGEFLEQFEARREAGIERGRAVYRPEDMPRAEGDVIAEEVAAKGVEPTTALPAAEPAEVVTPQPIQAPPEGLETPTLEPVLAESGAPTEIAAGVHKIEPPQQTEWVMMQKAFDEAQKAVPGYYGPRPLFKELEREGVLLSWREVQRLTGYRTREDLPKDLQRIVRKEEWRKGAEAGIKRPDLERLDLLAERALTPEGDLYPIGSQYRIDPRADLESQLMDILIDETTAPAKRMSDAGQIYIPGPEDLRTALKTLHDFEPITWATTPARASLGWMSKLHDISPTAAFQLKSAVYEQKIIKEDVRKAVKMIFGELTSAKERTAAILAFEDPAVQAQFTPAQQKAARDAHAFLDFLYKEQETRGILGERWPHTIKAQADAVREDQTKLLAQMEKRLAAVKTEGARERVVGEFRKRITAFDAKIKKLDDRYDEVKGLWYFPHVIRGDVPEKKILGKLRSFFRVRAPMGRKYTMQELTEAGVSFEQDPAVALAEEATKALSRIKAYDTLVSLKGDPQVVMPKGSVTGKEWVEPVGIPELGGTVIRREAWDAFQDMIRTEELTPLGRAYDTLNNTLKFIRFYNPLYMTFNNLKQQYIAGGLRPYSPTWYGDFMRAVKSFRNKDDYWKEGVRNHLFGRPYNYGREMTDLIQRTLDDSAASLPKRVWNEVARALDVEVAGKHIPINLIGGFHKGMYATTWGLDEILRMQTSMQLERIGYTREKAMANALDKHANYDLASPWARKIIRRFFLTGQYQTAMANMYKGLAEHPVEQRGAIARATIAKWVTRALMLGGVGGGAGGGYFFWNYYRFVKVRDDEKENVLIFTGPQNIPEKYAGRTFGRGNVGVGMGYLYYALSSSVPHYLLSLRRNKDWKGDTIYLPGSGTDVAGDIALFSTKEMIAVSDEVLRKRGGLDRLLNFFTIVRYERPEASRRIAYSYKQLRDEFRPQQAALEKALDKDQITQARYDRGAESLRRKWDAANDKLDEKWKEYFRKADEAGELAGKGFYDPQVAKVVTKDMIEQLSMGLIDFEKGKGEDQ